MTSTYEAVQGSKNVQEALLHIAQSLDLILDNQTVAESEFNHAEVNWEANLVHIPVRRAAPDVETDADGNNVVTLQPVTEQRKAERLEFAATLGMEHESWYNDEMLDAFAKGGGLWLYTGNREFVMSLDVNKRRWLVEDVASQGYADEAWSMQADLFKEDANSSADWARKDLDA